MDYTYRNISLYKMLEAKELEQMKIAIKHGLQEQKDLDLLGLLVISLDDVVFFFECIFMLTRQTFVLEYYG